MDDAMGTIPLYSRVLQNAQQQRDMAGIWMMMMMVVLLLAYVFSTSHHNEKPEQIDRG